MTDSTAAIRNVLRIDSSINGDRSVTLGLADDLEQSLLAAHPGAAVTRRDLAGGVEYIDGPWVDAGYTPADERSQVQQEILARSDALIAELDSADAVIISAPMYNFAPPATLKAWIDLVVRPQMTFAYTENGPRGLLRDRPVYLVIATGGVPLGSPADFLSGYLKQVLGFIGLRDVRVIAADGVDTNREQAAARAQDAIQRLAA